MSCCFPTVVAAFRRVLCFCATVLVSLVFTIAVTNALQASEIVSGLDSVEEPPPVLRPLVKIDQQPFYNDLEQVSLFWDDSLIGNVEDLSPHETLLNFYAVMAKVGAEVDAIRRDAVQDPGLGWSPEMQERIHDVDVLFRLAIKSLNGSDFPESVRGDLVDEAAIQLKLVLDYVFSFSRRPIEIPGLQAIKKMNVDIGKKDVLTWRLPGTGIVLSSNAEQEGNDWYFSPSTVASAAQMYQEIEGEAEGLKGVPFATPDFYRNFIRTPGHLVPPKWYLTMPSWLHELIEVELFAGQTLFQLVFTALIFIVYLFILFVLVSKLFSSHFDYEKNRSKLSASEQLEGVWKEDEIAWKRVLLVAPVLPLTTLSSIFVDDYLNFTGIPLVVTTYFFYVSWCMSACVFAFYFFESVGKSGAETLLRIRGIDSPQKLQRWGSRVQPICRALSGIVALFLIYRMLIQLGLPGGLVLALSSVPGLAIALGASKLLSNLFAGLSIQTDRPLRVGEFCRIGEHLGYVTKIGLRSIEIQTLGSTVAIPNSIADDSIIVNFSDRTRNTASHQQQCVEIRMPISHSLTSAQVNQLIFFVDRYMKGLTELAETRVDIEQTHGSELTIIGFGYGDFVSWSDYLEMRKSLFVRFKQILAQVLMSRIVLRVSYQTSSEVRARIPAELRELVLRDDQIKFGSCELLKISDYSYDYIFDFRAFHLTYGLFLKAVDRINHDLLLYVESENIVMPFPTSIFIQKPADLLDSRGVNPV